MIFPSTAVIVHLLSSAAIGALIGWLHFGALRRNVRWFVDGTALWRPLALQMLRMLCTAAALLACAYYRLSLPAALIGLLLARQAVLRKEAVA